MVSQRFWDREEKEPTSAMTMLQQGERSPQTTADGRGHGEKKSRHSQKVIAAILEHGSLGDAARSAGISERSLRRWMHDPTFETELRAARRRLLDGAINRLRRTADGAVSVLDTLARDEKTPASVRVAAAFRLITAALQAAELQDLGERMDELEGKYAFGGQSHASSRN